MIRIDIIKSTFSLFYLLNIFLYCIELPYLKLTTMENDEYKRPIKRLHLNDSSYSQTNRNNPNSRQKLPFILNQSLADQMISKGDLFQHYIDNKKIYFPYEKIHEPQKQFMEAMFNCLEKKDNLLIESPTGTGKTLNLLVSALQWSESHYQNSDGGVFDNQTKIIYTSRSHSQLDQISKQLEKTPYRPKMLIFGSREKLCINEEIERQLASGQKDYQNWNQKCNIAVRIQQRYLENQTQIDEEISQNKKTVQKLTSRPFSSLNNQQKEQLKSAQEFLNDVALRCTHYQNYDKGLDVDFFKYIGRSVINNGILKDEAREFKPHSICPYNYPKRVKNRATLYLMPYNYILDSMILKYSTTFLQNSIIIFDQGHNAPQTACQGFSVKLHSFMFQTALKNINNIQLSRNQFDTEQQEKENLIRDAENQSQSDDGEQMEELLKQIRTKNIEKNKKGEDDKDYDKKLEKYLELIRRIIKDSQRNFQRFFKFQRTDDEFKRLDSSFSSLDGNNNQNTERRNFYWQPVRRMYTYEKQKMENWVEEILFCQMPQYLDQKSLKEKLSFIIEATQFITEQFIKKGRKFFKLMSLSTFFVRLYKVLYDEHYKDKFFLEVNQQQKYQQKLQSNIYHGQIKLRCLAPDFSFKMLESINPRSIIITSGTLSPTNVFGQETGLSKLKYVEVDPVITAKNILVRKISKNLNGDDLKIDSTFYCGRYGLEIQNLTKLFDLLIKTIENIPHGVLVIVSSKSCLSYLKKFYDQSPEIRQKLHQIKQHVYFQPKRNLQFTMESYIEKSQTGKGALLFCVCRGKLSQGIDFKDRLCRSVIFLGIPYVNKGDPFVVSKGKYLKKMKSSFAKDWKFIEASKAINQGLGRTVRNSNDFGSILLFDDRYHNTNQDSIPVVANISEWIKKNWQVSKDHDTLEKELSDFYLKCEQTFKYEGQYEN